MAPLHALVYQSQATRPLDANDLDRLLLDARVANELVERYAEAHAAHPGSAFWAYLHGRALSNAGAKSEAEAARSAS